MLAALLLLAFTTWAGWNWLRSRPEPGPVATPAAAPAAEPAGPDWDRMVPDVPAVDLPGLGASDAFIREMVRLLSSHPQLAAWLVSDDLVRRFVLTVVNLAGGSSPTAEVPFLIPDDDFRVEESGGRLFIHPASYRRYDRLTEVFVSMDGDGAVQLYHQLHPLFQEAFLELGLPGDVTFDEVFARATWNLLAVSIPAGPVEVRPHSAVYEFADPGIEARTPAEKHIVRMGPDNGRRFQEKLGEISRGLGIPEPGNGG